MKNHKTTEINMNEMEQQLDKTMFLGGSQLTYHDKTAWLQVKDKFQSISPVEYPNVFRWVCFVAKFDDKVRNTWGETAPEQVEEVKI